MPRSLCDLHVEAEVNSKNNLLATENTPENLRVSKVFIVRDYTPSVTLGDAQYVLPTKKDDTKPAPEKNESEDKGEDKDKDKEEEKDEEKDEEKNENKPIIEKPVEPQESVKPEEGENTGNSQGDNQSGNNAEEIMDELDNIMDGD